MRYLWLILALCAWPAKASDFGVRYPAGTIRDTDQARAVLKEADSEMARIAKNASERDAECLRGFFVNSCRDDVRRDKELAEREVRRVRIEARDVQRRVDAERIASERAERAAAQAAEDARRPANEEKARAATKAREEKASEHNAPAPAVKTESIESGASSPKRERLSATERADNVRKFQQKQELAQKRAQEVEAERVENERRRAEKRKQVEQREAEREAIRKKAAES